MLLVIVTGHIDLSGGSVAGFIGAPAMNLLKMSGAEPALLLGNGRTEEGREALVERLLRQAALVVTREEGRQRINSLNAVPIRMIYERWVSKYEGIWASALLRWGAR